MDKETLMKRINQAIGNAKKLQEVLTGLVVDIAKHAQATGDGTPALFMYKNLPNSQRRKAMAIWWKQYTGILIKDSDKGISVKVNMDESVWNLKDGEANPFYELDEAKVGKPMGEIDAVSILTKKLESLQAKIAEWEAASDEQKIKIFKLDVNPTQQAERLMADIKALTASRKAA